MAELTEEDIKNMSPEQLRQLQKQNCIFCHIIAKRVQSRIIYEDEKVLAVLDINPANPGHIILMPKEHYNVGPQMPEELSAHMGMMAKQLSRAALRSLGAEGTTIISPNGIAAGQRASHFMMHIIPRREGDGIGLKLPQKSVTEDQVRAIQAKLAPIVGKALGSKPVEIAQKETPKQEPEKAAPMPESPPPPRQEAAEPTKREPEEIPAPPPKPNLDSITDLLLGGGK